MKVVIDTNVIVAALLNPFGACGSIVRMLLSNEISLCFDARILSEYETVLKRPKFDFKEEDINTFIEFLKHSGLTISSNPLPFSLPDPDDEPFLEAAVSAKVQYLVTGNRKHFPMDNYQNVNILSPSEFIDSLKQKI